MFGLEAIWRNGQVVGHIRRADFGFAIDKTIAYGYIRDPSGGPVSRAPSPPREAGFLTRRPWDACTPASSWGRGWIGGSLGRVRAVSVFLSERI